MLISKKSLADSEKSKQPAKGKEKLTN